VARPVNRAARRASPLYASLGPRPCSVHEYVTGDLGLSGEAARARVEVILEEHRRWREQHLEAWAVGQNVPGPPYADRCDVFAKPAA
jgi:hypothetical protein